MVSKAIYSRLASLLLFVGPVTSLAVSPFSNFDPINLIKVLFLASIAFSVCALILTRFDLSKKRLPKIVWFTSVSFVVWMLIVIMASGAPINQQLWGVFGRSTGFVMYVSLLFILLGAALVQERRFYRKLVWSLVLTAVPTSIYAVIQVLGRDPISWSLMQPFATFGNINFSSAFFGLSSVCASAIILSRETNPTLRFFLIVLVILDLFIIFETGSIQGFMIFIAGLGFTGYFFLRDEMKLVFLRVPYLILGGGAFTAAVLGLVNIGPFARYIFSETVQFRFDYWFAGWAMTLKNPLLGVGLDSYGDWYRELRGELATLRTTPDRITNSAHNIFLDLSSGGGLPLLLLYLMLLFLAGKSAFRLARGASSYDPFFVAMFSAWIAYLIQAFISINQVSVGVWGWLLSGAIIGYERCRTTQDQSHIKRSRKESSSELPAASAISSFIGAAIGFTLAFLPFNADSNFKEALQSSDLQRQFLSAKSLGATAYHMELVLDSALKANDEILALEITSELTKRYPRDFMAWRVRQVLSSTSPEQRQEAYEKLKEMDPFNPDIQPN